MICAAVKKSSEKTISLIEALDLVFEMTAIDAENFLRNPLEISISKGRGRVPPNFYQHLLTIETDQPKSASDNSPDVEDSSPDYYNEQSIIRQFFGPGGDYENDTVVILSDGQFYVPRVMMFWSSQYFRNLIEIIPDSDPNYHFYAEIQVFFQWKVDPNRKFTEIFEMIRCLFPCPEQKSVDFKNFRLLLKLSYEYQIKNLKHLCHEFLLREVCLPKKNVDAYLDNAVELFELAARYDLEKVFETLFQFFVRLKTQNFKSVYETMDSGLIAVVLDAKLKLLANYREKKYLAFLIQSSDKSPSQLTTSDNGLSTLAGVQNPNNLDDEPSSHSSRTTDEYVSSGDDYYSAVEVTPASCQEDDFCTLCGRMMKNRREFWICGACSKLAVVDLILYKKIFASA